MSKQQERNNKEGVCIRSNKTVDTPLTQSLFLEEYLNKGVQLHSLAKEDFYIGSNFKNFTLLERELYGVNMKVANTYDKLNKKLSKKFEELFLTTPVGDVVAILNETFEGFFKIYLHECELPMFERKFKTSWYYLVSIYQKEELSHQFYTPIIAYKGKISYIFTDKKDSVNYNIGSLGQFLATCFIMKNIIDFSNIQETNVHVNTLMSNAKKWLEKEVGDVFLSSNEMEERSNFHRKEFIQFNFMLAVTERGYPSISKISKESMGTHCPIPEVYFKGLLHDIFVDVILVISEKISFLQDIERETLDYAASFMPKKYIPQHVIYGMQMSKLNNYFGYVEYDERFDRDKSENFSNKVSSFIRNNFPWLDLSSFTIRLRRLGKYKEGGLYFVSFKCLCVDINSPDSFIHAFGLLINHYHDFLSFKSEFLPVRNAYKVALNDLMQVDQDTKQLMKSKTKYNMMYYISSKEIFARSFELYVKRKLELSNELIPAFFADFYCEHSSEYMTEVENYFDSLLRQK